MRSSIEAVDPAVGVVSRDLVQTGVHDRRDPGNGQRRLGDVRRDDDSATRRGHERQVLFPGRQRAVQRQHVDISSHSTSEFIDSATDLGGARQETQHVSRSLVENVDGRVAPRSVPRA